MRDTSRAAIAAAYHADEDLISAERIAQARFSPAELTSIQLLARGLVDRIRKEGGRKGGVDAFTQEYALSTEEGIALMCLAEALLRVPDAETADMLIRDKIAPGDWESHIGKSDSLFVNASTWGLMLTGRIVRMGQEAGWKTSDWNLQDKFKKIVARSGEPVIRQAIGTAMRMLGGQFVLGRSIKEALRNGQKWRNDGYRYSFDMLGEAAYTKADAARYLAKYEEAIDEVARGYKDDTASIFHRPSVSVKLSALHPRYEWVKRERVFAELMPRLVGLAKRARLANVGLTIDAEEADRHELFLDLFEALVKNVEMKGWNGLGLAVQAYQKRALPTIHWLTELARTHGTRLSVRLVKGAYWDTEIKRAQEAGLREYPVFTRKTATDTSYIACARALFAVPDAIYPMFATHNAHTISAIEILSGGSRDFEFQRLHGMGDDLHAFYHQERKGVATRIYAPVGSHEDLLAYLVRRLLENGANTSFVNRLADDEASVDALIADPVTQLAQETPLRNVRIPLPADILGARRNSSGFLWSDPVSADPVRATMERALQSPAEAMPLIGGAPREGAVEVAFDPSDRSRAIGRVSVAGEAETEEALEIAVKAQAKWDRLGGEGRAEILEKAADLFEKNRSELMALIVREAGKTLPTAVGEVREAVDFLRYYAAEARAHFSGPVRLPGPTGESNELTLHGKGVFACISPWNFPLAIFTGQIAGALAAGNAVLAKPAETTPLVAMAGTKLLLEAGVPGDVLHLLPGSGPVIGKVMFADPRLAGAIFTGSTRTATAINRALAMRDGPIATVIAETGGQNAMIVDSTALPEQVARDAVMSAFDSAGQRCSALRVLFVQEDVADKMLDMIIGFSEELAIGDPFDPATDIGPVINETARQNLSNHAEKMTRRAKLLKALPLGPQHENGFFFAPHIFEIGAISDLEGEVFGPVMHVVRYGAGQLDKVCEAVNSTGFGLTLGVHSRIEATAAFVRERVRAGNIYVNRNQIGAVVGVQPFGGEGLSGTGPKAGGPQYLHRLALERTYTVNTTASGGNVALLSSS
ncbi:RHH-type proline utilization regulon transcriptional repressor/proline dehydrogenase/delta 1-pyrroline-5-carboxylate dehydrogenase [Rhizomicrobium palustre]|uniref:Bifunctional protein PutA n=1 Tax=Rhizomicrobium palustre TaxID=189966 RepID=A0A846N3N9_9PROT|nr:bifunctional proline dehydrogenase/L-glutamate gamma-semialdehyde dehydrogenase PutA [Rhizomicrobium palustre]NIK90223.1 RHH-type proline utilization regulon transcriptional repressor/proline dehydrogenase/delta 1-pyrroline-5-carboxylate dehydrogenase [Rhizomicrobium palustre]